MKKQNVWELVYTLIFIPLFVHFQRFKYNLKTTDISGIGTRFIGVHGEHADHSTTINLCLCFKNSVVVLLYLGKNIVAGQNQVMRRMLFQCSICGIWGSRRDLDFNSKRWLHPFQKYWQKILFWQEPWSSSYGRRLMSCRLWVRIPALYTVKM